MKFSVLSFQFVVDKPGMCFGSGSVCPQASQTCCDTDNEERTKRDVKYDVP